MSGTIGEHWGGNKDNSGSNAEPQTGGGVPSGLLGLLQQISSFSNQRTTKEVDEVVECVTKQIKSLEAKNLPPISRQLLPKIVVLTNQDTGNLPGLCFQTTLDKTMYIMPVLFINAALSNAMEEINIPGQMAKKVSMPFVPSSYLNNENLTRIKESFKNSGVNSDVRDVVIVNGRVVHLESFRADEVTSDTLPNIITNQLMSQWHEAFLVTSTISAVKDGHKLFSPFIVDGKAYGPNSTAIARTESVKGFHTRAGETTPHNLVTKIVTTNGSNNQNNQTTTSSQSKELVSAFATVQLLGNPLQQFIANMQANPGNPGNAIGPNGAPIGYRPLTPLILMGYAQPGEMMGYNGGLQAFFTGLYALLTTNTNYISSEGYRGKSVGHRGNLTDMERRIDAVQSLSNYGSIQTLPRQKEQILTEAGLKDADVTFQWIQNNITQHAMFGVDICEFGIDAAIHNFLACLLDPKHTAHASAVKTAVAVIDSETKGAFSAIALQNEKDNKGGWTLTTPILRQTQAIIPVGTARQNGAFVNLGEVDEMFVSKHYANNTMKATEFLGLMYGNSATPMDPRVRKYELYTKLNEIFDNTVDLYGFAQRGLFLPSFLAVVAQAYESLGTLSVTAPSLGMSQMNTQVFAEGMDMYTTASAGNINGVYAANGQMVGNGAFFRFG